MMQSEVMAQVWRRFDALEQSACLRINRASHRPRVRRVFAAISRLGDGPAWFLLVFSFAASSAEGAAVALQMSVAVIAGLLTYGQLKHRLVRERPYISHPGISLGTAPLDRYSFPSGHTLHACSLTTIGVWHVPELALILVPFALLVAASRVVLGLHYPTDVAAGAALGCTAGVGALRLLPL